MLLKEITLSTKENNIINIFLKFKYIKNKGKISIIYLSMYTLIYL
jgi:hypothetical protein